jgi:hypothetical protein
MTELVTDVDQLRVEVGELVTPFFDRYTGLDAEVKKREEKIEEITKQHAKRIEAIRQEREAAIAEVKKEIAGLRDARSYLRNIVRGINPDLIPPMHNGNHGSRNGKPKKKKSGKTGFSVEKRQETIAWVQSRRDELNAMNDAQGFRPTDIEHHPEWNILKSSSAVNKVFIQLHEDFGIVSLNKWVRGRPYGDQLTGKFYKVI